ncbi:MAG: heme NO-binding domain-containing protein, partial [Bacteroidota bacterium]
MKGIVFTEFLEMVEDTFGFETADNIVSQAELPSGGVYTAVGTYPALEMVSLVGKL